MSQSSHLHQNWHRVLEELKMSDWRQFLSPATFVQYEITLKIMREYVYGRLIDLGCGDMPFQKFLIDLVESYDSLDLNSQIEGITYIGDIQNMSMIDSFSYDSAICLEVLEHVSNPQKAIEEIYRILKLSGILVISVPHLSRLHNIPNDYFRFTEYGLTYLLRSAGFSVLGVWPRGGIFSFLGHQVATLILSSSWDIPFLRKASLFLVKYFVTIFCYKLDQVLRFQNICPLGYVVVARK